MKKIIPALLVALLLGSCVVSSDIHFSDPNYLSSEEFSTYEELALNDKTQNETIIEDTIKVANHTSNDYYDYSYSSRIRRFHRPMYNSGYYEGLYTDYFFYNNDPFYCGTSIYYGYNWNSPYYSYYSYSPFYPNHYSPYYYGNYFSYNNYGLYNSQNLNNSVNTHDAYISGHRNNLSSNTGGRKIKINTNNLLSTKDNKNSTINIRLNDNNIKNNVRNYNQISSNKRNDTKTYTTKNNSFINKSNTRNTTISKNNNKTNRTYRSNSGQNRSKSTSTPSRNNRRTVKPRR